MVKRKQELRVSEVVEVELSKPRLQVEILTL